LIRQQRAEAAKKREEEKAGNSSVLLSIILFNYYFLCMHDVSLLYLSAIVGPFGKIHFTQQRN
jgi:hypothetical protein